MGLVMSRLYDRLFIRDTRILMLGLDGAGKTTLLYKLKLDELCTTIPTIGFNVEEVAYRNLKMSVWDVGGQDRIRALCARVRSAVRTGSARSSRMSRAHRCVARRRPTVHNARRAALLPGHRLPGARTYAMLANTYASIAPVANCHPFSRAPAPTRPRVPTARCHVAQIFVVDANDRDRLAEAGSELQGVLADETMVNPLVLVYANKCAPHSPTRCECAG